MYAQIFTLIIAIVAITWPMHNESKRNREQHYKNFTHNVVQAYARFKASHEIYRLQKRENLPNINHPQLQDAYYAIHEIQILVMALGDEEFTAISATPLNDLDIIRKFDNEKLSQDEYDKLYGRASTALKALLKNEQRRVTSDECDQLYNDTMTALMTDLIEKARKEYTVNRKASRWYKIINHRAKLPID